VKDAKDLIPWKVIDLGLRPFPGLWSFNPSVHFDGEVWRLVLRCCDYAMPGGKTIRSKSAGSTGQQTKNAMVILDPTSWKPIQIFKMHERDGYPRASTPHVGFEDMRIFKTDKNGLQGIAASLHLQREGRPASADEGRQHQPPEQVLLSFDAEYNIVDAHPIRGGGWSGAQKNWVPYNGCVEPRFLFSIDKGRLFSDQGPVHGDEAIVRPSVLAPSFAELAVEVPVVEASPQSQMSQPSPPQAAKPKAAPKARGRMMLDAGSALRGGSRDRTSKIAAATRDHARKAVPPRHNDESTRMLGTGRSLPPGYSGLRGGSQLLRVGSDAWLGIGHAMRFEHGLKYYWHTWYLTDSRGKMIAASEPMKLAPEGIEFAAGLAIDGDRVVVSFGVDDMRPMLGETSLSAVMEKLMPLERNP
jgi:hypothetical protein